jgi:hypothetical protein
MSKIKLSVLLLCVLFISCSRNVIENKLLVNKICEPPCWQNITPSVSTLDQVKDQIYKIENINIRYLDSPFSSLVYWNFLGSEIIGEIRVADNKVISINFQCDYRCYHHGNGVMKITDAITNYGDPEFISWTRERQGDSTPIYLHILYPKSGILLSYPSRDNIDQSIIVKTNDVITSVQYICPDNYENYFITLNKFDWTFGQISTARRFTWHGFGVYGDQ